MDPQQQQQVAAHMMAGMGAFFAVFALIGLAIFLFMIFLLWRIFTKAGLAGALSLLVFVPGIGILIVLCILAFSEWKVAPIPPYASLPPQYPPPPTYPPAQPPTY